MWQQEQQAAALSAGDKGSILATPVITGASRFHVVFSRNSGSRKQRAKREGTLSVAYDVSYLYAKDNKECVLRCKAAGQGPNKIFTCMQRAHRGADWVVGTELSLCGFDMLVEEVMELHLIPYEEDVDAAGADSLEGGAGCGIVTLCRTSAPTAPMASSVQSFSAPALLGSGGGRTAYAQPRMSFLRHRKPLHATAAMEPWAPHDNDPPSPKRFEGGGVPSIYAQSECLALKMGSVSMGATLTAHSPTDSPLLAPRDERCVDGSVDSDCCSLLQRQQRRRRRSATSLARELERCYPQYF
ncbi:hypothetical protein, conserved [Leishmania lindenbergi]|uniref:Uncharacterized protein n=1 Tax=Leishmania lindenbergi TaxID=651832 RepID=A0AAW3ANB3_9TRYP